MSWLQLKLQMLPSIANEIKTRIKELNYYVEEIDAIAERGETDNSLMQQYSRARAQMKARMEEISIFYNENLDDEKIHFFEKLRLQIKKALFNRPGKQMQHQMDQQFDFGGTNADLFSSMPPEGQPFFERPNLS